MSAVRCLTVMYHYVRDRSGTPESGIRGLAESGFERQLDLLCERLTPIDWPALLAWRAGRRTIPEKSVLLTFDDGLLDHAEVVFPILEKRGLRAVFFVQTATLVEGRMDASHQTHLLMCHLGVKGLANAATGWLTQKEPRWGARYPVDHVAAERVYHYETPECARLKHLLTNVLPISLRDHLLGELFSRYIGDTREWAARWYSGFDQLAAMQSAGHTIGGHGHTHEPFSRLSPTEQARDMAMCSTVLSDRLGSCARPMSYPYGVCDDDIARRCAFCSFVNGFTTEQGWISAFDDAHRLRRVDTIDVNAFLEREFTCVVS